MGEFLVLRRIEFLARLAPPARYAIVRDQSEVVHADAEPRVALPRDERETPDLGAIHQGIALGGSRLLLFQHVRAASDREHDRGGDHG